MERQIALLRGINVGRTKRMEMARLREMMGELGYEDVRTYVQSGNVVFSAPDRRPTEVERHLTEGIAATFGFDVPILVRTRDEIADVVAANPLGDLATNPSRYHVFFLSAAADPERVADIEPASFAPETFALRGRELYLWTPDGIYASPLAKTLSEKRLGVTATARNWRTVEKLLAMADAES
jgi:uncharacterized protein (DUF1697 family)